MNRSMNAATWALLLALAPLPALAQEPAPPEATPDATGTTPADATTTTTEPEASPEETPRVAPAEVAAAEVATSSTTTSATTTSATVASAADEASSDETELDGAEATQRVLTTADQPVAPAFAIWQGEQGFIKPVLQMSAMLVTYIPHSDVTDTLASRTSTLALSRFGFEGELFGFLSFRSVFERNLGYSLARNGPVGTSVWEGTASLQARENYLRLHKWGLSLTGGILRDPATADYVSVNILDAFGMDPYVRDPLLVSGFSQGQGFMLRYNWRWLTGGVSFTAGNPLTSSLAFGFGGDVSALGTLFSAPLRALSNGIPGSDIHMYVTTPSLSFEHAWVDVKVAAQIYRVDPDVTADTDLELTGYNLRATTLIKPWRDHLSLHASFAYRSNEQLAIPDLTMTKADYEGFVAAGGFDFRWDAFGLGATYYWIRSSTSETDDLTNQYVNVGMTYWLREPNVSIGLRWARSMAELSGDSAATLRLKATDSFILSMRLLL
ncbi:MAG: hypothetical protein H6721_14910 [Sandaracinus sp.]|nr:hypothetical protein [Sandaracinus sp.]